jgi:hypothetical protein
MSGQFAIRLVVGTAVATGILCGHQARAVVVTDNFSDFNDTASPTWTHLDGATMSTLQTWDASTGRYHLTAPSNGTHPLFPGYAFVGSYTGPTFEDVRVSADIVDFTPTDPLGSIVGVAARMDGDNRSWGNTADTTQGLKGYGYMYEANANTGRGEMVLVMMGPTVAYKDIGSQKVTLDNTKDYRFVLEAIGTALHGQVFELNGAGQIVKLVAEDFRDVVVEPVMYDDDFNSGTPEVAHVPYSGGYSGVWGVGHVFYRDADYTVDNFVTETVLPGDYNRDGAVNAADYIIWRKTLGNMGPVGNCTPDCTSDPIVFSDMRANGAVSATYTQVIDDADLAVWKANFGETVSGSGGGVASIPEPATIAIVLVGLASFWSLGRRAR